MPSALFQLRMLFLSAVTCQNYYATNYKLVLRKSQESTHWKQSSQANGRNNQRFTTFLAHQVSSDPLADFECFHTDAHLFSACLSQSLGYCWMAAHFLLCTASRNKILNIETHKSLPITKCPQQEESFSHNSKYL